ncbi:hypothetical protein ILYODFUR_002130 [Ilyodon furcidens]|uniref:Uncharacterized protein n=1 Tax=Ilyodon furcidens TaxID=33524 RepID=A0ABV0T4K7_9TELE
MGKVGKATREGVCCEAEPALGKWNIVTKLSHPVQVKAHASPHPELLPPSSSLTQGRDTMRRQFHRRT